MSANPATQRLVLTLHRPDDVVLHLSREQADTVETILAACPMIDAEDKRNAAIVLRAIGAAKAGHDRTAAWRSTDSDDE